MKQRAFQSTDALLATATSDPDPSNREHAFRELKERALEAVSTLGAKAVRGYLAEGTAEHWPPPVRMLAKIVDALKQVASAGTSPDVTQAATHFVSELEQVISGRRQCAYCNEWFTESQIDSRGYCGRCRGAS